VPSLGKAEGGVVNTGAWVGKGVHLSGLTISPSPIMTTTSGNSFLGSLSLITALTSEGRRTVKIKEEIIFYFFCYLYKADRK